VRLITVHLRPPRNPRKRPAVLVGFVRIAAMRRSRASTFSLSASMKANMGGLLRKKARVAVAISSKPIIVFGQAGAWLPCP